jgi:heme oxygenase
MSMVMERVEERKKDPNAKRVDLEKVALSKAMRRETWSDHARAEYSDLEQALVKGTLPRETYGHLMAQTYFIYEALELKAGQLAGNDVASAVIDPVLNRSEKCAQDVAFYLGDGWRDIKPLQVTEEYVARILDASPEQFVAHHYTRYLADLSGGLMIDRSIKQAYGLEQDGRRVYDFTGIDDADVFKQNYRKTLDELPLDVAGKRIVIDEVMVAYEFNIELIAEMQARFPVA